VGLWLPRGTPLLVMQLAIAKTGAAWLPMDADTPTKRVWTGLEDPAAKGLISRSDRVTTFASKMRGKRHSLLSVCAGPSAVTLRLSITKRDGLKNASMWPKNFCHLRSHEKLKTWQA